jgi:hypothetical protein
MPETILIDTNTTLEQLREIAETELAGTEPGDTRFFAFGEEADPDPVGVDVVVLDCDGYMCAWRFSSHSQDNEWQTVRTTDALADEIFSEAERFHAAS